MIGISYTGQLNIVNIEEDAMWWYVNSMWSQSPRFTSEYIYIRQILSVRYDYYGKVQNPAIILIKSHPLCGFHKMSTLKSIQNILVTNYQTTFLKQAERKGSGWQVWQISPRLMAIESEQLTPRNNSDFAQRRYEWENTFICFNSEVTAPFGRYLIIDVKSKKWSHLMR